MGYVYVKIFLGTPVYLGASADMGKHGGSDVPANETGHTKVCPYKISPFKNVADTAVT